MWRYHSLGVCRAFLTHGTKTVFLFVSLFAFLMNEINEIPAV